ncbi:MAG: dipeptidyl carboxypeptidase II, partial [Pseudomonadota bacterium]
MILKLVSVLSSVSLVALSAGTASAQTAPSSAAETPPTAQASAAIPKGTGYFASDSDLPFLAPDFTKITEDDYLPAFDQGMAIHKAEVQAIIDNAAAPSFDNTIVALEVSGRMLGRVSRVFFQLTGTNTTDRLDAINTEISPKLTAHNDSIVLNPALFARVKAVYDARDTLGLDIEDATLLERTYDAMVHAGALLTEDERDQVKAINTELSTLATQFSQEARAAMSDQPLIVDTAEELAGLSESDIQAAADLATKEGFEGKFAIALQNTTQQPV